MQGVIFSILAGAAMSIQGVMNTRLGQRIGTMEANVLVQCTAAVLSLAALAVNHSGDFGALGQTPKLYWLGGVLGLNGYEKIWALFGSANQLLAGLGLLAVATWLGNIGKNNKMFLFPMGFMLIVTICSLIINTKTQIAAISAGGADWGPYVQAVIGVLLVVLAVILAIEGIQTIAHPKEARKA